ncbi:phosphoglycerate kinase [Fusibacter sp. JL298sf-3]
MFNKKTVEDIDVRGKRVLVRCDFNVPIQEGKITDENRINGAMPTIEYLVQNGAKVILCSHLGKPKSYDLAFTLKPVADRLSEKLGKPVVFNSEEEVVGPLTRQAVEALSEGDVLLLENTRFRKEETKNGEAFSKELASLADVFVNDAFGTAHRAHASTVGVTAFIDTSVCGYLIQKELKFLGEAVETPVRPFCAILGGAKVSDKIKVIENLITKVDTLIIGGGMAYTFLKAQGYKVGKSLVEEDKVDYAKQMLEDAKVKGVQLLLPTDHVVATDFDKNAEPIVTEDANIEDGFMGLDIGPKTAAAYAKAVLDAKTVVWNGPMGVFEFENFAKGTIEVAKALASSEATTIIGGGDSAAAVNTLGFGDEMTHISTGGGASLEFLEGLVLPGIDALNNK